MNKSLKYIICGILLTGSLWGYSQSVINIGKTSDTPGPFRVTGRIFDAKTNEPLVGTNIYTKDRKIGTTANEDGWFQFSLKKGRYGFQISFTGYNTKEVVFNVRGDGNVKITLEQNAVQLGEVVVSSEAEDANVKGVTIGKTKLSIGEIATLPAFAGEIDIIKSLTLLPGISTLGESSSGFNVRGGSSDQNLISLGGATLYNPSHLFGFFTAFNSNVIKDVTIYKGGIPAKYGGRGSSVVDVGLRSGNMSQWGGQATAGTSSSKLLLEGPIIKDKLSVLVAGRVFYVNWLLNSINDPDISSSAASFNDVNAVVNYQINSNNNLRYSYYRSSDDFNFLNDTTYRWSNQNHVLEYNHSFSKRLSMNLRGVISQYEFSIENDKGFNNFKLTSNVLDQSASLRFDYLFSEHNVVTAGVESKLVTIDPGVFTPVLDNSSINPLDIENERGLESGAYLQHDIELGKRIGLSYGLRFSDFRYIGEKTVASYKINTPVAVENIVGRKQYSHNQTITHYNGFEPRVSLRYSFWNNASIKAGFNQIYQYAHLISNTTTIAPTDIWKLSDPFIKPTKVTQYSLGVFKNFFQNALETSVEGFYKQIDDIIEYKDGAKLLLNENLETELLNGQGKAYGVEAFIKKKKGKFTGWASYTFSRSVRQVIGSFPEELINNGEWFPSNYDKPHDFTGTLEYKFNDYVKTSTVMTYSTGQPVTYPVAKFNYLGETVAFFEKRNLNRAPDYMRIDWSLTFRFNARHKIWGGDFVFSVYNLLGRKNTFSIFFDDVPKSPPQAFKFSVLGIPFPSLSYSVKF